ncbi:MAG TPA: protocatechuate 3,4-dioxygenase subunit alpha [Candidatus Acidoferrales bacterium]|jgi:protocatechuate 3,4-dioxygenase alpha subunit|nr:protocatechuate 3,4-dioxygenase subunit alpha [Candidatus Acidoferrales bacterium]
MSAARDQVTPPPSASQTVGPFFHLGMVYLERENFVPEGVSGERITIRGKVLDGNRNVVPDAVLEIWQADSAGQYASELPARSSDRPRFLGFGRVETNDEGEFRFATIKPGRVRSPEGPMQAPHIVITLFSRGLLKPLHTRIYFPDEASNADDPVLNLVPAERRSTLIATPSGERGAPNLLYWNIVMQGDGETVFFDYD